MADNFNISDIPESAGPKSVQVPGDIADGTDGELLTWDAAGVAALVTVGAATQVLTSNGPGAAPTFQAGGGGATAFLALTDTPASYVGQAGRIVRVNNGQTALEFANPTLARFTANDALFPTTVAARPVQRNDHGLIAFEDTVDKEINLEDIISALYNANRGVQVVLHWAAATAIVGDVNWVVAFENLAAGGQDLDSDGFAGGIIVADTTNGTAGVLTYTVLTFTNAQADAIAPGNSFRLRVSRNASGGPDTMVGDAQLLSVHVRQN